jgi:uncharacterized protein YcbK (DUF882 family)
MNTWPSKYFTEKEFLRSNTLPNNTWDKPEHRLNALFFISKLDIIRIELNYAISITSGYRCEKLNGMVGGAKNSDHKIGFAADLIPVYSNVNIREFHKQILEAMTKHEIEWNQLIYERNKGTEWVHLGIRQIGNKKEVFNIIK